MRIWDRILSVRHKSYLYKNNIHDRTRRLCGIITKTLSSSILTQFSGLGLCQSIVTVARSPACFPEKDQSLSTWCLQVPLIPRSPVCVGRKRRVKKGEKESRKERERVCVCVCVKERERRKRQEEMVSIPTNRQTSTPSNSKRHHKSIPSYPPYHPSAPHTPTLPKTPSITPPNRP